MSWRKGFTKEAREIQRKYAQTKSVFLDPAKQAVFGRRGGKKKSEKRDQAAINRQPIEIRKSLANGTLWYHKDENIFIKIPGNQCKFVRQVAEEFSKKIPRVINKNDRKWLEIFTENIAKILKGSKKEYNGFVFMGVILDPFVGLENFHLERYFSDCKETSQFQHFQNLKDKRKAIGSVLGSRSQSKALVENMKLISCWSHESNPDKIIKLQPIYKNVTEITEELGRQIGIKYNSMESKQFSALIKNAYVGRVRKGWTLVQLGNKKLFP